METSLLGPGKFWIFIGRVRALRERRHTGREERLARREAGGSLGSARPSTILLRAVPVS